jgi:hypothetical protein
VAVDGYATLLSGRVLEEGQGFPGIAAIDEPLRDAFQKLGLGREEMASGDVYRPFWYFYDKGPFSLTLTGEEDDERGVMRLRGLLLSGSGAPGTRRGVRIGDPIEAVTKTYGVPQRWSTTFGSPHYTITSLRGPDGKVRELAHPDAPFKESLYYPAISTFFVPAEDKVSQIGIVAADNPVAIFLRPRVKPCQGVREDTSIDVAKYLPDPTAPPLPIKGAVALTLHVPPIPTLASLDYAGLGRIVVPRDWTRPQQGRWTDPRGYGTLQVGYVAGAEAGKTLRETLAIMDRMIGGNQLPPWQRTAPTEFLELTGADEAYALLLNAPAKAPANIPLRIYILIARKGERQYSVFVDRTVASPSGPSPDGVALASGIMRGLRFTG